MTAGRETTVHPHEFVHEWSAESPYCGAMVMRNDGGETCGLLRDDPVHAGREATPAEVLVKGLRKAVADPETEWVDANIVRLLLDRYEEADRG